MIILDGKYTSKKILNQVFEELSVSKVQKPNLDIILVGNDPASKKYVSMKQRQALEVGIGGTVHELDENVNTNDIVSLIKKLNSDPAVTAFMVQLPLPKHVDSDAVLESIDPTKDADGLTVKNLGLLLQNNKKAIVPATPLGIMKLLEEYNIEIRGKNVVIIGRSNIVGKPLFAMFTNLNATVTLCHTGTENLKEITKQADILVVALGKTEFIDNSFVKEGVTVIDVGTNIDSNGKLKGDVNYNDVASKCSYITPVPGGVGPMTVAALLFNTLEIWKRKKNC